MDQPIRSHSWPAAPRGGNILVRHPAWEAARNAVLDLAAEGPVTVFLTGEPGSGKTWLLRELAASFTEHGFPTMALLRGDLPIPLGDGVAVLVDEASYMPDEKRAFLAVQDRGIVVLADIGPFVIEPVEGSPAPIFIHLRLLEAGEIASFVADWLQQERGPSMLLEPEAVPRLAKHSGGAVRLIVQLLGAAIAVSRASGTLHLTAELIDQVASFRLGGTVSDIAPAAPSRPSILTVQLPAFASAAPPGPAPETAVEPPPPMLLQRPVRRAKLRFAMTGTALAASVLAAWLVPNLLHREPSVVATSKPAPELPPIQSAESAAPELVPTAPPVVTASRTTSEPVSPSFSVLATPAPPAPARESVPATASEILPPLQTALLPEPTMAAPATGPVLVAAAPDPSPAGADTPIAAPHPVLPTTAASAPVAVASIPKPVAIPVIASTGLTPVPAVARPAVAGLVLVARPGDTLERLYADIYRDRRAPPFGAIQAANPDKLKPGSIVLFPEPVGGWRRIQR